MIPLPSFRGAIAGTTALRRPEIASIGGAVDASSVTEIAVPFVTVVANQYLLLWVQTETADRTHNTPAGWTQIGTHVAVSNASSNYTRGTLFGKYATGSETGSVTVTFSGSVSRAKGFMLAVDYVDLADALASTVTTTKTADNVIAFSVGLPTITPDTDKSLGLCFVGIGDWVNNTGAAAGGTGEGTYVERYYQAGSSQSVSLQSIDFTTQTGRSGATLDWGNMETRAVCVAFALKPRRARATTVFDLLLQEDGFRIQQEDGSFIRL